MARSLLSAAFQALEARKQEANDLNVYPVPDGDTGTNLALSVRSVVEAVGRLPENLSGRELCAAISQAALMGARGNSGVILSQIIRGATEVLGEAGTVTPQTISDAFRNATDTAYRAVRKPVEGTMLTVQAVVSDDHRFVRLTVVPLFAQIGEVNTFQFSGSESSIVNTSQQGVQDEPNDNTKKSDDRTTTRSGVAVQLPTYASVNVSTTVSVPDGGTILLGGIKRLSEGRNEFGVPMLDKLPYVNRLFKNVGIGRETQSLMMMVTPRIIIQEEEEERLGIVS